MGGPVLASSALTSLHHTIVLASGEPSSQILERRGNTHVQVDPALVLIQRAAVSWLRATRNLKRPIKLICYCC